METSVIKHNGTLNVFGELNGHETLLQLAIKVAIGIYFNEENELPKKLVDTIVDNLDKVVSSDMTIDEIVEIVKIVNEKNPSKAIEMIGYALGENPCIIFDKCYDEDGNIYYEYTDTSKNDDEEQPTIYHDTLEGVLEFLKDHFKEYSCSVKTK